MVDRPQHLEGDDEAVDPRQMQEALLWMAEVRSHASPRTVMHPSAAEPQLADLPPDC